MTSLVKFFRVITFLSLSNFLTVIMASNGQKKWFCMPFFSQNKELKRSIIYNPVILILKELDCSNNFI